MAEGRRKEDSFSERKGGRTWVGRPASICEDDSGKYQGKDVEGTVRWRDVEGKLSQN